MIRYEPTATLSVAADQASPADGVSVAVPENEPGAEGATPSRTRTTTPAEETDIVVNERPETGSVIVRPTSNGASLRSVVAGVVSRSSVAWGESVGLAVPLPIRIVTPDTAGDPADQVSKEP